MAGLPQAVFLLRDSYCLPLRVKTRFAVCNSIYLSRSHRKPFQAAIIRKSQKISFSYRRFRRSPRGSRILAPSLIKLLEYFFSVTGKKTVMDGNHWGKNKDCSSYRLRSNSENGTEAASKSSKRNMSTNVSLFKKYLFDKAHQNVSNADVRETDQIMRTKPVCRALLPYQDHDFRMPSFLERELVVGIKSGRQPPTVQSRKAQLTIFYAGTVNVYDNVPVDKAQAIMLLAGGTSSTKPAIAATARRVTPASEIPSVCEVGADVPRKQSLRRFLEKRRDRITQVAPYFSIKKDVDEATMTNCLDGDKSD